MRTGTSSHSIRLRRIRKISVALSRIARHELNALSEGQTPESLYEDSFGKGYDAANSGGSVQPDGNAGDEEDEG